MEEINGVFYMKGCPEQDPACLHSPGELAELVQRMGFLPLFANEIPGFSVEERVPASWWWSEDPASDPWAWRQLLAPMQDLAYGKLFAQRAGYVSARWFPVLANARREGYDFDARWEDEKASSRAKKLMDALEPDEAGIGLSLLTSELKQKAGFGKGGERNFEGVLTQLQMQTYLIIGDFRQRLNRSGMPYGWHQALIQTPETKWGYEAVASSYRESPADSEAHIVRHLLQYLPEADPAALARLLGFHAGG